MPRQVISTDRAPASEHYAQAVRSGDLVFISGQIPLLPDRTPVNGSFEDQNVVFHEFFAASLPARSSIEGYLPAFEIEVDAIMRLG